MTLGEDPVPLVPRTEPTFLPEPEPRALWCPVISVDDHVVEPPDLFERRVPRSLVDGAPVLVDDEQGIPFWIVDGLAYPFATSNGSAGRPVAEWVHMRSLTDRLIDEFHATGRCEFVAAYAYPYALLSIANLLGVPEADHGRFLDELLAYQAGSLERPLEGNPFAFMDPIFLDYVEDRREHPQPDVITKMATATFPDGSLPEPIDVVRIAVFLFAAGQGTTAHLMRTVTR